MADEKILLRRVKVLFERAKHIHLMRPRDFLMRRFELVLTRSRDELLGIDNFLRLAKISWLCWQRLLFL